jgi:chondroitin-sulfate-ABC endolyase/exolyase
MRKEWMYTVVLIPLCVFGGLFNEYSEKITTGTHSFEDTAAIENWTAVNGSFVLSKKRAKVGRVSALWTWKEGGHLLVENPAGLKGACEPYEGGSPEKYERKYVEPGLEGGVKLWLYNETPSPGRLTLQVGHDAVSVLENPRYKIPVNLSFSGWRAVWVHFEQDAKVENYTGEMDMNAMALVPAPGSSGTLHIDWMNFVTYMSLKRHSDDQVKNNKPDDIR